MSPFKLTRAALLAGVVAFPLAALAQAPAPAAPANPADTAQPAAHPAEPGARLSGVERRVADLHTKLHITPAQEQAWNQFAQVMRDNAQNMEQTYQQRASKVEQMSAVDNMQSYAQLAMTHAQDVQKLVPAFQTVYASFSPDQQHTADQLFRSFAERGVQRHSMEHHG